MTSRNRGKRKMNLRRLSQMRGSMEDKARLSEVFRKNSEPIVTAILGQAILEGEIDAMLCSRLGIKDDDFGEQFMGDSGPMATFNAKIMLGQSLRLYPPAIAANLHIVRRIRNAFAHSKILVTFEHELIVGELRTVQAWPKIGSAARKFLKRMSEGKEKPEPAFTSLCYMISIELIKRDTRRMAAARSRASHAHHRKMQSMSSFFGSYPKGFRAASGQADRYHQSGDPNTPLPLRALLGSLATASTKDDSKDK